jgi:hypothetical protein
VAGHAVPDRRGSRGELWRRELREWSRGLRLHMARRTTEAAALLRGGGVLVIRLRPLAQLLARPAPYAMNPGFDTYTSGGSSPW